jgi:SAM-dependent methyltransferase
MSVFTCDCCGGCDWEYLFSANGLDLGRCPDCGLHYVAPNDTLQEHYEETGILLDARLQMEDEKLRIGEFEAYIEAVARFAAAGKWMDLGCGAGMFMQLASNRGIAIEGIELTPSRAALAREVSRAKVYGTPLEDLGLPDESFAAVIGINVFSHLRKPSQTLAEIRRVLAPNGVLMLVTGEIGRGLRKEHNFSWPLGEELYYLGEKTIEAYGKKIGFQLVQRSQKWLPDFLYGEQRFREKGRSLLRNLAKKAILYTPGALPLLRTYVFNKQKENPAFSSTLVMRKC